MCPAPLRDKYFRINARVIADGQDLSEMLVVKGLAIPYDGGTKTKDWCVEALDLPFIDEPRGDEDASPPTMEQNQEQ